MSLTWLVIGLLIGLGVMLAMAGYRRLGEVTPTAIDGPADLHTVLRSFLTAGDDRETLFIVWYPSRFEVRVTKRTREAMPATLDVEVPGSGANSTHYPAARDRLVEESVEFAEEEAPSEKLLLSWPDGGPFVVSAAANVIGLISGALPRDPDGRCAAACQPPQRWSQDATLAAQ